MFPLWRLRPLIEGRNLNAQQGFLGKLGTTGTWSCLIMHFFSLRYCFCCSSCVCFDKWDVIRWASADCCSLMIDGTVCCSLTWWTKMHTTGKRRGRRGGILAHGCICSPFRGSLLFQRTSKTFYLAALKTSELRVCHQQVALQESMHGLCLKRSRLWCLEVTPKVRWMRGGGRRECGGGRLTRRSRRSGSLWRCTPAWGRQTQPGERSFLPAPWGKETNREHQVGCCR